MSVEQLNHHYSMNNPASVYDEEALTVLELAGRLAKKVVEIIDLVNKNELTIDEAVKQFWADYNEAKQYMVDNLPDYVENSVENLKNSGELESMLVNAMLTTKLDKNGVEQITYEMLTQQVKEMFTGGNTPVVGTNAVSTANIVDNSVSESKLHRNMWDVVFYSSYEQSYYTPVLLIDTTALTATFNPACTNNFRLNSREASVRVTISSLLVNASSWKSGPTFDMYYDPNTNTIHVVDANAFDGHTQFYYLGGVHCNGNEVTNVIPVQVDKHFYMGNSCGGYGTSPLSIRRPVFYHKALGKYDPTQAFFDFDFSKAQLTMYQTSGNQVFCCEGRNFTMNLATLKTVVDFTGSTSRAGVWWNPITNTLTVRKQLADLNGEYSNELYFGFITDESVSMASECIIPYTTSNGAYYIHPEYRSRPIAQLMLTSELLTGNNVTAKVDFKNRRMIIPAHTQITFILGSQYTHVTTDNTDTDIIIPFADGAQYQYLVGGVNGLRFLSPDDFISTAHSHNVDELYYVGYVNEVSKSFNLNFSAEKLRTYAVLGDSISTFEGVCPSGWTTFYDGTNAGITTPQHTWWGRVADRCGLQLVCNIARSGLRATPSTSKANIDGIYYASELKSLVTADPDVILVYIGINDFNHNVAIGNIDPESAKLTYECKSGLTFAQSYLNMLLTLKVKFPDADIYCMTLPNSQRTADTTDIENICERNENGEWLFEYNKAIRDVCDIMGTTVVDLASCPFTQTNREKYFTDAHSTSSINGFLHPNAEGMKVIANKVIKAILDTKECD